MKDLKFKKGEFITQNACPNCFAIFGGQPFDPIEKGGEIDYSLICYYNPAFYEQRGDGTYGDKETILEYDLDGESTCEYTIQIPDMDYWRLCTEEEKKRDIKFLAEEKRIAWDEIKHEFRRMVAGEKVLFDDDNYFRQGETIRNPYYGNNSNPNSHTVVRTTTKKLITRFVKDDWEQKEPIATMTVEHKELVLNQCEKLKHSFYESYYTGTRVYPQNGAEVPRRVLGYGAEPYCSLPNLFIPYGWCGYED